MASWELASARLFLLFSHFFLGNLAAIQRRVPELVREAVGRGDLFASTNLRLSVCNVAWLVADDPTEARRHLQEAEACCPKQGAVLDRGLSDESVPLRGARRRGLPWCHRRLADAASIDAPADGARARGVSFASRTLRAGAGGRSAPRRSTSGGPGVCSATWPRAARSRLVAEMNRTSTARGRKPPTRATSRASMTCNSVACIDRVSSPTSSRNAVPPSADSMRPGLDDTAPEKAPRS